MDKTEKIQKLLKLAEEVLKLSRDTLLVNLRFLDLALSQFQHIPIPESSIATDGMHLFFNPGFILQNYKLEKEIPVRDYLHIVLHCVFQHMYGAPNLNRSVWDLACDIAVEHTISELGLKAATALRQNQQDQIYDGLRDNLKQITAEKVYHYLLSRPLTKEELAELRALFYADNHEIWYLTIPEIEVRYGISLTGSSSTDSDGNVGSDSSSNGTTDYSNAEGPDHSESLAIAQRARSDQAQTWKDIAERMQTEVEAFGKQQGHNAGGLSQNLNEVNREKYDYTEFLKKFAVRGEAMQVNDDEFDYIFYTYGLKLYGKVPLIEPLEYKEVKRIREFVIAIDTSGSTSGELVQKFVQKTYNILKSTESFFSKINLHIIQCDAEIQEDVKITSQEEFDEYLKHMQLHGMGGTDFRPVFHYVEKLRQTKEFQNLRGLIYFTDGYGNFPARKPDYETAFVFLEGEYNNPDVPAWAIKLVLQPDEI